jgi:aerobic-type carbon monoxide dehydrogenase small subunit (CoxS/CutS family)
LSPNTRVPHGREEERITSLSSISIVVNGVSHEVNVAPATPLLWVLRDALNLTGTKYGCGLGLCGACTVHLDGQAVRSCQTPVQSVGTKKITTIEGLSHDRSHPLQKAWIAEQVPQCGYCQSGQIMQAASLLTSHPKPTREQIDDAMTGNICRCATYQRIRRAIQRAAGVTA